MEGWITVLCSLASALLGGAGGGGFVLKWQKQRHDQKLSESEQAWQRMSQLNVAQQKQIVTLTSQLDRALHGEGRCRQELVAVRADGRYQYEYTRRLHAALLRANIAIDELPEMPARFLEARFEDDEATFVQREAHHTAGLLQTEADSIREQHHGASGGRQRDPEEPPPPPAP